ncbi:hypothetical protein [Mycobacterium marinum]|uniref:phage terminase small subunit n=1 Tax=Mycobacterium marinum TaxID=1781 RepID=UPI0021C401FA|nr:hypothetical protein [Mycobacterium marinum]
MRARRNKTSTRAVLKPNENPEIPPLPKGPRWYAQVREWWTRAWSSPMVSEWTDSDVDAMYLAAKLMQQFWKPDTTPSTCKALAGEIRQLLAQCGLTPMSRRALQWEIERPGQESTAKQRQSRAPAKKAAAKASDPRARFQVVK